MAEKRDRRPRNEEQDFNDEDMTDLGDSEENQESEDIDDGEDEDLDEDVIDEEASGPGAHYTAEIGSEGGSAGNLEERRPRAGISRGSEATETGRPSSGRRDFFNRLDRH